MAREALDLCHRLGRRASKSNLTQLVSHLIEQVTPHPPILRGLQHVVAALKAAGHILIDWQGPVGIKETREIMGEFWAADGGEERERF
jgi:hypothetical protein